MYNDLIQKMAAEIIEEAIAPQGPEDEAYEDAGDAEEYVEGDMGDGTDEGYSEEDVEAAVDEMLMEKMAASNATVEAVKAGLGKGVKAVGDAGGAALKAVGGAAGAATKAVGKGAGSAWAGVKKGVGAYTKALVDKDKNLSSLAHHEYNTRLGKLDPETKKELLQQGRETWGEGAKKTLIARGATGAVGAGGIAGGAIGVMNASKRKKEQAAKVAEERINAYFDQAEMMKQAAEQVYSEAEAIQNAAYAAAKELGLVE